MMAALALQLTTAGLAAVRAASGTSETVISQLGLSSAPFVSAPTLLALPGEFKRLAIEGGTAASQTVIHLTAYDETSEVWNATGFGLYLDDGTLFATYSAQETVLSKAGLAFALLAFDIALSAEVVDQIAFGAATFVWPPATQGTRGIARIATDEEAAAQEDAQTIITPRTLGQRLGDLANSISQTLTSYASRSLRVTGGGLVSGGGDLSQDRQLSVSEASAAQVTEGTSSNTVVTPRRLGPITMLLQQNGFIRFFGFQIAWGRFTATPNAVTAVQFAEAFPTACFSAVVSGVVNSNGGSQDNPPATIASTITASGFSVFSADDEYDVTCYIAVGH
ncbi:gp53-like domain-containing protein [Novosphingobium mangrovi (ex Hu et al. 2023)]|uniref:Putative tail fiber protein gp53-like C-terminal domain-containing protein n=1 Tax=Novosphingobium mangrovi (ex Hu et al. 2023) TaxID=2930094 RepID=A0ABT0A8W8_9SPHN|nr:hypothetical protein [Novosphingobium mangrovi (ex Hu et al. 2023)]MCJ1959642.1 hypothetical protein [Novosphingobium mangrovi (ex Hu et al. 2023)]